MKCFTFIFFSAVMVVGLLAGNTAWAYPNAYTDQQVHDMVEGRLMDRQPKEEASWWQGLGGNATSVIIGMYNSENNTFHRARLLWGLSWIDTPQAIDFVQQQAQQTDLDTLRNTALRALGQGDGAAETDFISKFLKNDDPQTRLAAAEALRKIGERDPRGAHAKGLYDSYLKEEKTSWLLDRLNGKLSITGALKPVSSSEDRISPDFEGTWRGYWVESKTGTKGVLSAPVLLQLKTPAGSSDINAIGGTLTVLQHGKTTRAFDLGGASGRGVQLAGNFQSGQNVGQNVGQNTGHDTSQVTGTKLAFQGGLTRVGETMFLEIRVPSKDSVLVLKKD